MNFPSDEVVVDEEQQQQQQQDTTVPHFRLLHENTVFEFPSMVSEKLVSFLQETSQICVLSCLYAARDYLDEEKQQEDHAQQATIPPINEYEYE